MAELLRPLELASGADPSKIVPLLERLVALLERGAAARRHEPLIAVWADEKGPRRSGFKVLRAKDILYGFLGSAAGRTPLQRTIERSESFLPTKVYVRTEVGIEQTFFRSLSDLHRAMGSPKHFVPINHGLLLNVRAIRAVQGFGGEAQKQFAVHAWRTSSRCPRCGGIEGTPVTEWLLASEKGFRRVLALLRFERSP